MERFSSIAGRTEVFSMKSRLEIYILGNYKPGDADGLAEFSSQNVSLLKDHFDFHFVQFDKFQDKRFYQKEIKDGFQIHSFGTKSLPVFMLPKALYDWIESLPKDKTIFHLNHIYNLTNFLVVKQLLKSKIPYIITPHDSFVYAPNFLNGKPYVKRIYRNLFVNLFDKYVLDHAKLVHGITQQCADCLPYITNAPVVVVNNQVQDMKLDFQASYLKEQVLFIGRFNIHTKGIDLSLKAFQLYKQNFDKESHINFTLVGPADPIAAATCEKICQDLGLRVGEEVILAGKVPTDERNRILSESKVYLHLARTEGFGLSIAQALSCYKPVVVSKQVPIADKIKLHKAGFVVDSPEEAAQALAYILGLSPADYGELAMNARRCYEREFHPQIIKPQLVRLYLDSHLIRGRLHHRQDPQRGSPDH